MAASGPYERAAQRLLTKADETLLEKLFYKQPPPGSGYPVSSPREPFGGPTKKGKRLRRRSNLHSAKVRPRGAHK
jgi:hypothetical protein